MFLSFFSPSIADDKEAPAKERSARLSAVERFGYQLQKIDLKQAVASPADLLVLEPQRETARMTPEDVARLRKKPDGKPRLILAYLSISEAEDYRSYWQAQWKQKPPAWLDKENPQWKGNYKVRYWDPDWQNTILGRDAAPLDRIIADGYDGVYLDIVDGFEYWEEHGVKDARAKMIAWVGKIAGHARKARADFLVVPQNGEALARETGYLDIVDAIGREDLFFEGDKKHKDGAVRDVETDLALFQKAGKPVLLIEYCKKAANRDEVYRRVAKSGYTALITVRPLDQLLVSPEKKKP